MFYYKAAVMGALVLKLRFQCLIETVVSIKHLGLYAPLRIPFKRKWAAGSKTLELPEAKYLYIKKRKTKINISLTFETKNIRL